MAEKGGDQKLKRGLGLKTTSKQGVCFVKRARETKEGGGEGQRVEEERGGGKSTSAPLVSYPSAGLISDNNTAADTHALNNTSTVCDTFNL